MNLFHGSSHRFKTFRIGKHLSKRDPSSLMEGLGIYMTDVKNVEVARGYGRYIYKVEVKDSNILNLCNRMTVRRLIRQSMISANINPPEKVVNEVATGILDGSLSVIRGYKEITDWLDSMLTFYDEYGERSEKIFEVIERTYKQILNKYHVIKYNDRSLGKVYICIHHPEQLIITGVKKQY